LGSVACSQVLSTWGGTGSEIQPSGSLSVHCGSSSFISEAASRPNFATMSLRWISRSTFITQAWARHLTTSSVAHFAGRVPARRNSTGSRAGLPADEVDPGVDAGDERRGPVPGLRSIAGELLVQVTPVQRQTCGTVALGIGRTEVRRHETQPALAPQIELPEPVARRIESLDEEQVRLGVRVDVRNAMSVDQDLRPGRQAGDLQGFDRNAHRRLRAQVGSCRG
jgi:hypothetical protein